VDIDKEIDNVLGLLGYELKLEKIDIEKQIEKTLPNILVDRKQFQEVLFNLIRNAGQAIVEKGKIAVIAKLDRKKVLIDIKDSGTGIPEDKLKELFNPFFTTKDPGKGTGLGLFIVRQVVEKNGGKIYLKETKVGAGTTFTVEFPAAVMQESRV
jgi:two-component system NtrC family sensor kinase